jgi:hypothetical protein
MVPGVSNLLFLLFVLLLMPRDAQAYVDPGSGSLIFQAIAAVLAGILVAGRAYWTKIKSLFGRSATDTGEGEAQGGGSGGVEDSRDD